MRLTKQMRESLITIIVNQTKAPQLSEDFKNLQKDIQEWVFNKCDPCFKQYHDLYGVTISNDLKLVYDKDRPFSYMYLSFKVPMYNWLRYCMDTSEYISQWESEDTDSELWEFKERFEEIGRQQLDYENQIDNLRATINSCTTDKQLADMYPEFVQFFNKAGIVVKAQKHLPAKLGLPENLIKYGLKLTSVEQIEQEIKEANSNE